MPKSNRPTLDNTYGIHVACHVPPSGKGGVEGREKVTGHLYLHSHRHALIILIRYSTVAVARFW